MTASCNKVVLLGTIGAQGAQPGTTPTGIPCARFWLSIDAASQRTSIPCEAWGTAPSSATMAPGTPVFLEGWLDWRPCAQDPTALLVVCTFDVKRLADDQAL